LIIRTEAHQVPGDDVLERLELGCILGSTDQFDAPRTAFRSHIPKSNSSRPPSSVKSVFTLFPKWLTS
jgi:hypothetical protein